MKAILSMMLLLTALFAGAQNGGQSAENNSVKLQFTGYGKTTIVNKQACEATIKVKYNNVTQSLVVPGNGSVSYSTPIPGKITAKTETNCGDADFGLVELNLTQQILPITFSDIRYIWVDSHTLKVEFDIAEVSGINVINIQVSPNGGDFVNKSIVFPETTQANKTYSVTIKL